MPSHLSPSSLSHSGKAFSFFHKHKRYLYANIYRKNDTSSLILQYCRLQIFLKHDFSELPRFIEPLCSQIKTWTKLEWIFLECRCSDCDILTLWSDSVKLSVVYCTLVFMKITIFFPLENQKLMYPSKNDKCSHLLYGLFMRVYLPLVYSLFIFLWLHSHLPLLFTVPIQTKPNTDWSHLTLNK